MSEQADLSLLRRFEPVIHYTLGERFFPMDVDAYVRESSLWVQRPREKAICLVPEGQLTLDRLAETRSHGFDATYFIKFIEPLNIAELTAFHIQEVRQQLTSDGKTQARFRASQGRLARVGYVSRLVDALFSITLLARGRISGDTAAAAALTYQRMIAERERYVYHGRVARRDGWTVLQYWFFYPFNGWRSGFFGVNDHEADWEMLCLYLCPQAQGELRPEWVAYAAHDFHGDDLRRHWDDPEVEKVGEHPVVYAGAGSHASYFVHGEYLTELEVPFLAPFVRALERGRGVFYRLLRRSPEEGEAHGPQFNTFRVPFVDYARGDGLSIGPGQEKGWDEPCLLDPIPGWALQYRGMWGVYVRDPISGENAPAGPLYNRDGSVRRAWYDPVGWAGLDKVSTPGDALTHLQQQRSEVERERAALLLQIEQQSQVLHNLGMEDEALHDQPHLKELHNRIRAEGRTLGTEISRLRARVAESDVRLQAIEQHAVRLRAGEHAPLRAHLTHVHHPASDEELRLGCLAEAWASVSVGLVMIGFVALILFARQYLAAGLAALVALIVFAEAGFRRRLSQLITGLTGLLAFLATAVLVYQFFWAILVAVVLLAAAYLVVDNLRELWR